MPEPTTPTTTAVPDDERCEAITLGLFGPVRCPSPADVVAHGSCSASHDSELLLCNACRLLLASDPGTTLSGACGGPATTGLPNEYCNQPVSLDELEEFTP